MICRIVDGVAAGEGCDLRVVPPARGPEDAISATFDIRKRLTNWGTAGALETFAATREIIDCYHVTFVKGRFAGDDAPGTAGA